MLQVVLKGCTALVFCCLSLASLCQQMPPKADKQYEMGMYDEAAKSYQEMLAETSDVDVSVYERLADCYINTNRPFEAVATFEAAALQFDVSTPSYIKWAAALKKIGRNEEADEIISFASIKENVDFNKIHIADVLVYDIDPVDFNSEGNEFAPTYLGNDIVCVTDNYQTLQVKEVSSKINEKPHILVRIDPVSGDKKRLCGKLKDYFNDGPASYTDDGRMICFSKGHFPASQSPKLGNRKAGSIYVAETSENGDWEVRTSLPCNELGVANIYPTFSENGERIYFSSNRSGGFGGFDIYYMDRVGESWSEPINAGEGVNTEGDEISPSISAGKMYFASNRLTGFGGFDLFEYNLSSGQAPVNLGHGVNSTWDDYALITKDGCKSGYFTSNRPGGQGAEDIYKFVRTIAPESENETTINHLVSKVEPELNAKESIQPIQNTPTTATTAEPTKEATETLTDATTVEPTNKITETATNAASAKPAQSTHKESIPTFEKATAETDPTRVKTVYTIQIAAISAENESFGRIAKSLEDIGLVYKVYYHNVVKIRIGQFDHEWQARKLLDKVKTRGYDDAFVVKEELIRDKEDQTEGSAAKSSESVIEDQKAVKTSNKLELKANLSKEEMKRALENMSRYRIKIGSYTDISAFDEESVSKFGSVILDVDAEWTKVFVGDYISIEDAESIRTQLRNAGYNGALIYGIQGDKLIRIN